MSCPYVKKNHRRETESVEGDTSNRITGVIGVRKWRMRNWAEQVVFCPFGKDDGGTCNSEDTFSVRRYSDQEDC